MSFVFLLMCVLCLINFLLVQVNRRHVFVARRNGKMEFETELQMTTFSGRPH